MNDSISRQEAINALEGEIKITGRANAYAVRHYVGLVKDRLQRLPSAQPERLTDDDFETIRIHLNAYKENLCNQHRWEEAEEYQRIIDRFMAFASAQPEQTDCEYCHTDSDGYVFPLDKNSHAFIDCDKIILKANGWRGEAKIKYCPICGRRLTDG